MNELIKINEENGKQLVSAKELYLGLGLNKSNWSRWYPTNVEKNEFFEENTDWVRVRHNDEGNETMDFAISIEFAKHIAMMARTEKSHEYRNYFIKCEEKLKELSKPQCIEDILISSLKEMKALKQQVNEANNYALQAKAEVQEAKHEIQAVRDVVSINSSDWKKDTATLISKMALKLGGFEHISDLRKESYAILKSRTGIKLDVRLTNKRRRMADEGVCLSKRNKLNYIDVIAEDKKELEVYLSIIKEMAIKYGVA